MLSWFSAEARGAGAAGREHPRGERAPVFPFAIATLCVAGWIVCFAAGSVINSQPYRDYLNRATNLEILAAQSRGKAPKAANAEGGGLATKDAAPTSGEASRVEKGAEGQAAPLVLTQENFNAAVAEAMKAQGAGELPKQTTGEYVEKGLADLMSVWGVLCVLMVVVTFTPPNLALLGALAAVAGAAGRWMMDGVSKAEEAARGEAAGPPANVATLRAWASTMMLSALSRGFFVYLAMLSGLLVLTGDPFDKPSPGQYVRLAGTCSLFCFIVGWQPELLKSIIAKFITRVVPEQQVETSKTTTTKKVEATVVTQAVESKVATGEAGVRKGIEVPKVVGEERVRG